MNITTSPYNYSTESNYADGRSWYESGTAEHEEKAEGL
jgi:hypothetical protein